MSRTANDESSEEEAGWSRARNELFRMIMEGRSFSGRERNCCFLNLGDGTFATVSAVSGLDFLDDARCIAVTDWDGDGDQDLWISNRSAPRLRLMRNDAPRRHHYISLRLRGTDERTNRDAIGARVEIVLANSQPERRLISTLRAGEGFLSQSSKALHFGLGAKDTIDHVVVRWPGGEEEKFTNVHVDGHFQLTQGQGRATLIDRDRPIALKPADQALPPPSRVARVVLQTRIAMPSVAYQTADGAKGIEHFRDKRSTLINLWASWCGPCVEELAALTAQRRELADADLRVVSLSVDGLTDQDGSTSDAVAIMNKLSYPHEWGFVDAAQMDRLQSLHNRLFFPRKPLPLPTSLLIDERGRLAVIYRGPVTAAQVISDARLSPNGYANSYRQAACLPGRPVAHGRVREVAKQVEIHTRYAIAAWLAESGLDQDATEHFEQLYQLDREWAVPQRHLAKLYLKQNDFDRAAALALSAMRLDPDDAQAHNTYALVCSERGDQQSAERHLRTAIELDDEFAEAHNNLGSILASRGDLKRAGQSFQRAVQLDSQFVQAFVNLGSVYAGLNQLDHAIQCYQRAIQIDHNDTDAHNNLGTIYARQGRFAKAVRSYQEAVRADPQNLEARRNLQRAQALLRK